MRAELREWSTRTGEPRTVPMPDGDGLFLECVITDPPSSAGRIVDVYVPRDLVPGLLRELKHSAIKARSRPMSQEPRQ